MIIPSDSFERAIFIHVDVLGEILYDFFRDFAEEYPPEEYSLEWAKRKAKELIIREIDEVCKELKASLIIIAEEPEIVLHTVVGREVRGWVATNGESFLKVCAVHVFGYSSVDEFLEDSLFEHGYRKKAGESRRRR